MSSRNTGTEMIRKPVPDWAAFMADIYYLPWKETVTDGLR